MIKKMLRRWLPKSLLIRTAIITATPLLLTQLITGYVFFERHWDSVTRQLAEALASDIALVIDIAENSKNQNDFMSFLKKAHEFLDVTVSYEKNVLFENEEDAQKRYKYKSIIQEYIDRNFWKNFLIDALNKKIKNGYAINIGKKSIHIKIKIHSGVLLFETSRRRVFESTTYIFLLWSFGGMILFLFVALIFMRNQVRPILVLADSAERFGLGDIDIIFKPRGASEVRKAFVAFEKMKNRIQRQVEQRTAMLSGVSHDLKTPLTRMRLQLAMLPSAPEVESLEQDVLEMEGMIQTYLNYIAHGESEPIEMVDIEKIILEIAAKSSSAAHIQLKLRDKIVLPARREGLQRCIANIVHNAQKYGNSVLITTKATELLFYIIIDDDGPGIQPHLRAKAMAPFSRLDEARNLDQSGSGLGLAIARDIVKVHDGDIKLEDSPMGGLRVTIVLPRTRILNQ